MSRWLLLILALYLALALWYSVIIPLGEAPDEAPHYSLIRYVLLHKGYPTGGEEHEAFQPPLYYFLGALLTSPIDTSGFYIKANSDFSFTDPQAPKNLLLHTAEESFPYRGWALAWHLIRLTSVLMGAATVALSYWIAREIFPQEHRIALGLAAFNAFLPSFVFVTSVANNDNLATVISALAFLLLVKIVKGEADLRKGLLLGVLLGLGVLTKLSLLAFVATTLLALYLLARLKSWSEAARVAVAIFVPLVLISGPWFLRNQLLYGEPLGWAQVLRLNALRDGPLTLGQWLEWAWGLYRSFWLSWIGIELDPVVHIILGLGVLLSLVGLVVAARKGFPSFPRPLLYLMGMHILFVFAPLLRWTTVVLGTGQARLLYPALPCILIFIYWGWRQLVPRGRQGHLALFVGVGMFALAAVVPLRYIVPLYAPPPKLAMDQVAQIENRTELDFGGEMRLLGYEVQVVKAEAGETLKLTLYWQALKDIDRDFWLLLRLVDSRGLAVTVKDGSPSAGRYATDLWREGDIIAALHKISFPPITSAGTYRVEIGVHLFGTWQWLPIVRGGEVVGEKFDLVEIALVP